MAQQKLDLQPLDLQPLDLEPVKEETVKEETIERDQEEPTSRFRNVIETNKPTDVIWNTVKKGWDWATTPLMNVTEPTMEEWVRSPSSSATRSALAQATTPLGLLGELGAGVGIASRFLNKGRRALQGVDELGEIIGAENKLIGKGLDVPSNIKSNLPAEIKNAEPKFKVNKPTFTRIGENEQGVIYRNNQTGEEIIQPKSRDMRFPNPDSEITPPGAVTPKFKGNAKGKSRFAKEDIPIPPNNEGAIVAPETGKFEVQDSYNPFPQISQDDHARMILNAVDKVKKERGITQNIPINKNTDPMIEDLISHAKPVSAFRQPFNRGLPSGGGGNIPPTVPPSNIPPTNPPSTPIPSLPGDLPKIDKSTGDTLTEIMNFPKAVQSGWDLSFPFRQGAGLMHKKAWWGAWDDMLNSYGSEKAFERVQNSIIQRPLFSPGADGSPSFAKKSGLHLTDLLDLDNREEQIMSTWAEKIPLGFGKMTRRGNRAYTAFGNQLRADTFEELINNAEKLGLNPRQDETLAKTIANFVNSASGRGSLGGLEQNAKLLNSLFFSPRLIASRIQIIKNGLSAPVMLAASRGDAASRMMQKESLKTLMTMLSTWTALAGAAKLGGAEVSLNPTSSDFGKIKIGNTRLDPGAGLQQYLVFLARMGSGQFTPSTGGRSYEMGSRFGAETRGSIATRFGFSKTSPLINFAYELANANNNRPFNTVDRSAQMVTPLIVQDLIELGKSDPTLLPFAIPAVVGMGTQSYDERGRSERMLPDFIPETEFRGGGF